MSKIERVVPSDEEVRKLEGLVKTGTLGMWAQFINEVNKEKGWNEDERSQGDWAALVHTEVSEAFECFRENGMAFDFMVDGKPEGIAIEYADALIRILHWFHVHGLSVEQAVGTKVRYNLTRPYRHGGKGL